MKILGIETSCDETAAAVLEDGRVIRSSVVASQVATHARYSGVVPELASREHLQNIDFVVRRALEDAGVGLGDLQGIAVTQGPGLVGSLLVGLSYAKALAYACRLPLVTVNHLEGHIYSVYLDHGEIPHPILALVISGGHTNLFYSAEPGHYEAVGKTRDDAAGEAFDKVAKLLKLGYPGGPVIDRLSERGNPQGVKFSLPKITDGSLDFSFSGLKTAVLRYVQQNGLIPEGPADPDHLDVRVYDLLASFQRTVVEALLDRARRAAELKHPSAITLSGGVSCNRLLRARFSEEFSRRGLPVYFPRPQLTTDNAVMIAAAGHAKLCRGSRLDLSANAYPSLKLVES